MKIGTIIVDDEVKVAKVLEIKLAEKCEHINLLGKATNISEAYDLIMEKNPKLVFLDINMPGGSGFKLLELMDEIKFEIIFTTGYSEYALEALKVSAVDYLLKPIKTDELIEAVKKARTEIIRKDNSEKYKLLKHNLEHGRSQTSKIVIPNDRNYDIVEASDIIRCEGVQKYTKVFLKDRKDILSSYNIGYFENLLKNYNFFRSHKSHLVNINEIASYQKEGVIFMKDGAQVPLGRRKKDQFRTLIMEIN